jgi:hypothetical protein
MFAAVRHSGTGFRGKQSPENVDVVQAVLNDDVVNAAATG